MSQPVGWESSGVPADETTIMPAIVDAPTPAAVEAAGTFDPAEHTVDEVRAYLSGLGGDELVEYHRVMDAERAGKGRRGILGDDQGDGGPRRGQLVTFRHLDGVTGAVLTGAGVVLRPSEGGSFALVAPLDVHQPLEVLPDGLTVVEDEG